MFGGGHAIAELGSGLPNGRVSAAMKYRQDDDTMFLCEKIKSKANSFGFIPGACFDEFCTGGAMKINRQAHCLIFGRAAAFTSLHGTTSSGLAR